MLSERTRRVMVTGPRIPIYPISFFPPAPIRTQTRSMWEASKQAQPMSLQGEKHKEITASLVTRAPDAAWAMFWCVLVVSSWPR
ncbi:hypothetical protein LY78DRAFT_660406 [Colletotrichum sublineola]|nr:hypothetical protein LY78DRAFT_660406 [Colletotrichum sublineola]